VGPEPDPSPRVRAVMTGGSPVRYRMAGAIVLIFLAVVFLPWLFDGAGYEFLQDLDRPIPERPVFAEPRLPSASSYGPGREAAGEHAAPPVSETLQPAPISEARNLPESGDAAPVPAPAPALPAAPARPPAPPPAAEDRERVGWAVQIGFFVREANAREQAQRLREAGYPAFVEKAAHDAGDGWRVKIGPEVQRDRAMQVRDDVRAKLGIEGIVIAHP
jgi:DedD protein